MKTLLAACTLLTLTACGTTTTATDPDDPRPPAAAAPTHVPAADGPVQTRTPVTVIDTGTPELCLGPIAESYPPQCSGLRLADWRWADHAGTFERSGTTRWGQFAVTGTFDGTTLTVTDAVPAALHDPTPTTPPTVPDPAVDLTDTELTAIADTLRDNLPGAHGAHPADGHVFVDVIHDDGTLQAWADQEYGTNVVIVVPALLPLN